MDLYIAVEFKIILNWDLKLYKNIITNLKITTHRVKKIIPYTEKNEVWHFKINYRKS